jgi:energy-coupling factor transporter ATP-binding protein EcfA2
MPHTARTKIGASVTSSPCVRGTELTLLLVFGFLSSASRALYRCLSIFSVSGGERKRVSLGEMLSVKAALVSWDNAVRGLDSAVALHYMKVLKGLWEKNPRQT